ncbi:hypothetical protein VT84_11080 [Gemmata sp. SH-PL17]|uniref:DUF1501 domain-containing protein n=1 Tax=Gemmata sp. SH-PL17 TaxID=1630693 RepID=UPI00078D4462|nr:DUF1501 domain-containing protein [Gemmata sp. SH-PL17]AMV24933.1 hypothetical protein VT84_11080 [Gemmata sp. SH-PL17]
MFRQNRRELLRTSALGFGWLALTDLLAASEPAPLPRAVGPRDPLAPRAPHFAARAKRVIFLFMHGGPSQIDTFDYKPKLAADDGKPLPFAKPRVVSSATGNLLKSPFAFKQHGQSGAWVSELFPHVAGCADDLCFIKSMHGSNSRHGGALLELHTGSDTFVRPSMGSWVTYGLGTENRDLPGYVTICPTLTHGGVNNYSSAFLPAAYQATPLGNASTAASQVTVPFVRGTTPRVQQRLELDLLADLDRERATGADAATEGRIQSFEMAFRMQNTVPAVQDLSKESVETHKLYGIDDKATENFGRQCLMARRFAEAGVRFVQCTHSYKWDQHENLKKDHTTNAREVDKPIAGLLTDLKRRGLLKDTLVVWGGEFGRTPVAQGKDGRDHNPHGFTMFLAGGGVKAGFSHGATDDYGYFAAEDKVHVHDLHATILHLLGLDHTRLTYRHAGRDFRLTDVHGEVVNQILA